MKSALITTQVKAIIGVSLIFLMLHSPSAPAADWQWSIPLGTGRAFLWLPPKCQQVRALVVGQNNMIEQGILEHPAFRNQMGKISIGEIWIAPGLDTWQNATSNDNANVAFDAMLNSLADESGYGELKIAPVIPIGHSAMASYPWNFAAWNPSRTLAILSVHGDAPQTDLVGNGHPNVDWGGRNIDGIPGLMVMGEYEWLEERLAPALKFRAEHPRAPVAMLAEPGRGHFDYSDELVDFLAMFIRKSAEQRLPKDAPTDHAPILKLVDPANGWLVQRWHLNQKRTIEPAPTDKFKGDPKEAFWCFDREMAFATQNYLADQPGKSPQLLGFMQDGKVVPQTETHQQINLRFLPLEDGVTFHLSALFLDSVAAGSKNLPRWTCLPVGSPLSHAIGGGPIIISRISGPVVKINADTFRLQLGRAWSTVDRRNNDIWLLAEHPGDAHYKSVVQQTLMQIKPIATGLEQHINFPQIPDQKAAGKSLQLNATSDSGLPVYFYVLEGPVEITGDGLAFTAIPPRAKFPIKVTVVAWQWGHSLATKIKTAEPVEQTFLIRK